MKQLISKSTKGIKRNQQLAHRKKSKLPHLHECVNMQRQRDAVVAMLCSSMLTTVDALRWKQKLTDACDNTVNESCLCREKSKMKALLQPLL